ncbi:peptidylprolyl isomerase [Marinimicrobium alkaliphilum]|uniref:peptidylprolyl isomerase n=1 Tax=Marinimicrobium alkaliphilum TaxID=2202654 RepID=UPI000DB9B355|nr:peptidylprolyl isomerase [Marinimicrobium alkaliphilum]
MKKITTRLAGACVLSLVAMTANATIVQFQTVLGDFEVNLFDEITPETVGNFLEYVEEGAYTESFFHRSVSGFIVQGGGYLYDQDTEESLKVSEIDARPAVVNEPLLSNQKGTIAMAKRGNNPNSATSQWFFNLGNNSANLDRQNEGFTVFGQVSEEGLEILEAINELYLVNAGVPFDSLPLRDYGDDELEEGVTITHEHLVMVNAIVVLDGASDTAADLDPMPTTYEPSSSSSGSTNVLFLALLALLATGRFIPGYRRG